MCVQHKFNKIYFLQHLLSTDLIEHTLCLKNTPECRNEVNQTNIYLVLSLTQ